MLNVIVALALATATPATGIRILREDESDNSVEALHRGEKQFSNLAKLQPGRARQKS